MATASVPEYVRGNDNTNWKVYPVPAREIQVGDDVIAIVRIDGTMTLTPEGQPVTVTAVELPRVKTSASYWTFNHVGETDDPLNVDYWLVTARGSTSVVQGPDPFPHKCPNCGRKAYVGFTSIEHHDGGSCRTAG